MLESRRKDAADVQEAYRYQRYESEAPMLFMRDARAYIFVTRVLPLMAAWMSALQRSMRHAPRRYYYTSRNSAASR